MKPSSLFQLGGIAILSAAVLYAVGNLSYFLGGQPVGPTASGVWINFIGDTLLLLGLGALYARQAQRAGILGLAGYITTVVATMLFIGNYAVTMGVVAGAFTNEQIAQVSTYTVLLAIMPWLWMVGLILFGVATYRAQVLPKYAGALLAVTAVVQQLTGIAPFIQPIFAVLSFVAFAWLGWALLRGNRVAASEAVPALS